MKINWRYFIKYVDVPFNTSSDYQIFEISILLRVFLICGVYGVRGIVSRVPGIDCRALIAGARYDLQDVGVKSRGYEKTENKRTFS